MRKIVVADTETASISGPIVDFAAIEIDEELEVVKTTESLIDPQRPIAPAAQEVHGIPDSMVADAPTMAEYLEHFGNPFTCDELILIGHNVQFDRRMLTPMLPEKVISICTLRMARNQWPDLKPDDENHKLGTLAIMFGLERGPAHRAMGDAVTCLNLLRHIVAVAKVGSFEELLTLGTAPLTLESRITFGKHRGTKLRELPMDYVRWVCNQTDMDAELREALAARMKPSPPRATTPAR